MAALGSVVPLPAVFLFLTCAAHILTTFATCLMGRTLFGGNGLAALLGAVFVMGVDSITIGHASTLRSWHLTPQILAMPAALTAFWCGFIGRPILCALLAAGAALIHPTVGIQTGLIGLGTAGLSTLLGLHDRHRSAGGRLLALIVTALATAGLLAYAYFVWIRPLAPTTPTATSSVCTSASACHITSSPAPSAPPTGPPWPASWLLWPSRGNGGGQTRSRTATCRGAT